MIFYVLSSVFERWEVPQILLSRYTFTFPKRKTLSCKTQSPVVVFRRCFLAMYIFCSQDTLDILPPKPRGEQSSQLHRLMEMAIGLSLLMFA